MSAVGKTTCRSTAPSGVYLMILDPPHLRQNAQWNQRGKFRVEQDMYAIPRGPYASCVIYTESIRVRSFWHTVGERIDEYTSTGQLPVVVIIRIYLVGQGVCEVPDYRCQKSPHVEQGGPHDPVVGAPSEAVAILQPFEEVIQGRGMQTGVPYRERSRVYYPTGLEAVHRIVHVELPWNVVVIRTEGACDVTPFAIARPIIETSKRLAFLRDRL